VKNVRSLSYEVAEQNPKSLCLVSNPHSSNSGKWKNKDRYSKWMMSRTKEFEWICMYLNNRQSPHCVDFEKRKVIILLKKKNRK
jgi:hypothetical protein